MTSRHVFTMAVALIMVVWSSSVFFNALGGDILWKQIASAIGALLFWALFVMSAMSLIRTAKAVNEQLQQSEAES